jgi:hypothetical protein
MDFYIQMGHGMQSMCKDLLSDWGSSTVIFSPLNIPPERLEKFSTVIAKANGNILFDPQLYFPRKYHKNLTKYDYWPQNDVTSLEDGDCASLISKLAKLNNQIGSSAFILPSFTIGKIDRRWNAVQQAYIDKAKVYSSNTELLHTIALTGEALSDSLQVEMIIQYVEHWDVDGVYIVCEHPERYYLVDKPLWVSNLLALVAGIKRLHKKVIVGYASHQMLCLALSKCDAIASGNYLNVRWFKPDHFETLESDEISRRAIWYYCPQALSEYKVPFLDIAQRMNKLDAMSPPQDMLNTYCEMLFSEGLPSSSGYKETHAHRHYLHCLREQSRMAVRGSYTETRDSHLLLLETAEQILSGLRSRGIRGQDRDFSEIIDVNRAAIAVHDAEFQFSLKKEWSTL